MFSFHITVLSRGFSYNPRPGSCEAWEQAFLGNTHLPVTLWSRMTAAWVAHHHHTDQLHSLHDKQENGCLQPTCLGLTDTCMDATPQRADRYQMFGAHDDGLGLQRSSVCEQLCLWRCAAGRVAAATRRVKVMPSTFYRRNHVIQLKETPSQAGHASQAASLWCACSSLCQSP